ncbi:hypothetical protein BJ166DRAFT_538052 [Pestalotiopsis sp. NC0098]|nr:hypothetical protein BJ166DRAFT_538052 [Pestalotiopsis sp. NC0098]
MNVQDLTQTLVQSFNLLANEVQNLNDRQVVLEHKLRYAHEQFQYLADKYAPAAPEISETLAHLQLPPEPENPSLVDTNSVPLPRRKSADSKHQIALIIREGRRVASSLGNYSKSSYSSRDLDTLSRSTMTTAASTVLEQDFTVQGKKSDLKCPFSQSVEAAEATPAQQPPPVPHDIDDPICAAMYEEARSADPSAPSAQDSASKCPIRYMDQHSPEEIAHYLETHKHELPRSHEVCLRRYQKNEVDQRRLDAKYGNMVNMVEGLGRIHQPMLPEQDTRPQSDVERGSNERVETWAQAVSATGSDELDQPTEEDLAESDERQSHFDRPLKEVRLGESPSRPWGIPVPDFDPPMAAGESQERPHSPPPAPVQVPSTPHANKETPNRMPGKCPFDHTKMKVNGTTPIAPQDQDDSKAPHPPSPNQGFTPATATRHPASPRAQPTFLNASDVAAPKAGAPQMLFTGPVFIGYPIEQAIQFMQHFQGQQ